MAFQIKYSFKVLWDGSDKYSRVGRGNSEQFDLNAMCTARSKYFITSDSNFHNSFLIGKKMLQLKILKWGSIGKYFDFCCLFRFAPWIFLAGHFWTFLPYTFWRIELTKYVLGIKAFYFPKVLASQCMNFWI